MMISKNKCFFGIFILLVLILSACGQQQAQQTNNVPEAKEKVVEKIIAAEPKRIPTLIIVSPKDGELIKSSNVTVELKAENFNLVPVGYPVKDGEGHFHVWLDGEKKLGPQTIFTFENVVSDKHTITAELVKSDHSSLSPKIIKTITIDVESGFVPKAEQSANEFAVEADDNGFYPNKIQAKAGEKIKINFRFRDDSIYFAGLDVKGPFPTIKYRLKSVQPATAEFVVQDAAKIDSYWPSSGVHKATLNVEVEK